MEWRDTHRRIVTLGTLALVLALNGLAPAQYGGGSGTADDPYLICTPQQMNAIGADPNDWDKHFKLMADLDLSQYTGTEFNMIGRGANRRERSGETNQVAFSGSFDGDGHVVSNFTRSSSDTSPIGLFGCIDDPNSEIRNLHLVDPNVSGAGNVGGLVGWVLAGTISNCSVTGGMVAGGSTVGGLVGSSDGLIVDCRAAVQVTGQEYVGGLVGIGDGTVTGSDAVGNVVGTYAVGGLVGCNTESGTARRGRTTPASNLSDCFATGQVTGETCVGGLIGIHVGIAHNCHAAGRVTGANYIGGLIGSNSGEVTRCYATGSATGDNDIGGLVGGNGGAVTACYAAGEVFGTRFGAGGLAGLNDYAGDISNCYARGAVTGDNAVGGLLGSHSSESAVASCYSTGSVEGKADVGGLVGTGRGGNAIGCFWDIESSGQSNSVCGIGKTTAAMQIAPTYLGWGKGIWTIAEGVDYPRLAWEHKPGTAIRGADYPSQAGTAEDPMLIYTPEEMAIIGWVPSNWDKHFRLMADIDLCTITDNSFAIIGYDEDHAFTGVFDGNGHTISNFTYKSIDKGYVGLFGIVSGPGAEIKNLGMIDPNVETGARCYVGGLVGFLYEGKVTQCYIDGGIVLGTTYTVSGASRGDYVQDAVGGMVGLSTHGCVANCYSTATAISEGDLYRVAGLVGNNGGTVATSYAAGIVMADVTGFFHGSGLAGGESGGAASFWDVQMSGQVESEAGIGLTTAEMQDMDTYLEAGWDFAGETNNGTAEVWYMPTEGGYPQLTAFLGHEPALPDGEGTVSEPYLISDANELGSIGFRNAAFFRLDADIDLSGITWPTAIAPSFAGQFDGNGHVIRNLHICGEGHLGLFGDLLPNAKITDLQLRHTTVEGSGDFVGALAGRSSGNIVRCAADGSVRGNEYVGGLVGHLHQGSISTSCSRVAVKGDRFVGGLLGHSYRWGFVWNCYSRGPVTGRILVGGLAGYMFRGEVFNCYSTGQVTGGDSFIGGLVGVDVSDSVASSFWDTEASGQTSGRSGTGLTTGEMMTAAPFLEAGWDFVGEEANGTNDFWWIDEGQDYPRLWWEAEF